MKIFIFIIIKVFPLWSYLQYQILLFFMLLLLQCSRHCKLFIIAIVIRTLLWLWVLQVISNFLLLWTYTTTLFKQFNVCIRLFIIIILMIFYNNYLIVILQSSINTPINLITSFDVNWVQQNFIIVILSWICSIYNSLGCWVIIVGVIGTGFCYLLLSILILNNPSHYKVWCAAIRFIFVIEHTRAIIRCVWFITVEIMSSWYIPVISCGCYRLST